MLDIINLIILNLPICGEKGFKNQFWYRTLEIKKNSKNGLFTCQFLKLVLNEKNSCLMLMK